VGRRPFVVGVVHGLAGSATLTLFVVSTIPSALVALTYVAVFGAGTVVGMTVMSALVGLPLALAARTASGLSSRIQLLAAIGSIGFGCWYSFRVAVESGWLAR
jgi:high-affinity nickel-transport protein